MAPSELNFLSCLIYNKARWLRRIQLRCFSDIRLWSVAKFESMEIDFGDEGLRRLS